MNILKIKPTKPKSPVTRWTPAFAKLPALSIRQPFAWLIAAGFKDVENRGKRTHYRGPVLIHAGQNRSKFTIGAVEYFYEKDRIRLPDELCFGGVIAVAEIVDCVEKHPSRWFKGPYGYVIRNVRRLSFRACKGQLGFFKPGFD